MGYIYILTNPSFPDYIKIGYADNVANRIQQLNNSECTPFAFRVYATYEVDSRLSDIKIHSIIDKLNPNLRSIDHYNGKKRIREFYAMTAEDAYEILEAIAEIHNRKDKLIMWDMTEDDKQAEKIAEEIASEKKVRHANWTFDSWKIPYGAVLQFKDDPTITCVVIDAKNVEFNGETMYMTPLARLVSGKNYIRNGPGYIATHFLYNGEMLSDIEKRLYPQE